MIDVPTLSAIVVAVSVVIGLVFTLMELRHLAKTRRTDVIMRVYDRFGSREMVEAINSVGSLRPELADASLPNQDWTGIIQVSIMFEGLGVLLEQGLIDIRLVDEFFGPSLDSLWEPIRPFIYRMRELLKQPFFFSHFESLHNRLREYRKKQTKNRRKTGKH